MKRLLLYFCILLSSGAFSQLLNLPPRSATALTGSQFVTTISSASMSLSTRENLIYTEISNGNVPDFYRNMVPVTSSAVIGGSTQTVTYYVIPDYLAVGCDSNYFLCPMSPMLATQIADLTGCTLPTRKMVNDIWSAATVKLSPSTIPPGPGMTTVPVFDDHNTTVKGQRDAVLGTYPLGNLVSGDKKDVVISNLIYSTPNRVVIYGWHYTSGTAIQPLSNVHADTYMDYSHGIRLIQNAVMYNGSPNTIKNILQSSTLNPLLSDEGAMPAPQYPYSTVVSSLNKPSAFAVTRYDASTIKLLVQNDPDVTHYKVYVSTDGLSYDPPLTLLKTNLTLSGLAGNQIYFVKIEAFNQTYGVTSAMSEVLGAVTSSDMDSVLVVNGFDRASAGNTFDFIVQHGTALWNKGKGFSSCTNEALTAGIIDLTDHFATDVILGEESTANETFSSAEQTLFKQYLQNGGNLFVSGAEIGWDLDHLGTVSDKDFYNNYLMAAYAYDAPYAGTSGSCYSSLVQDAFYSADSILFDNGTHGTYNVDYPDVFTVTGMAVADMTYCNGMELSGLHFSGMFPGGSTPGKLVHWSFPFEAVYDPAVRNSAMASIIDFFFAPAVSTGIAEHNNSSLLVYPNPSSGEITITGLEKEELITLTDISGKVIFSQKASGQELKLDLSGFANGVYLLRVGGEVRRVVKGS